MKRSTLRDLATDPVDVLVIGGGIYGLMTARDAALRGLRTVLIERDDFGGGASHNSLKIMHGGIRYIQHLDIGRLRASAREQAFWHRAAPDLIRPLAFLIPLFGHGVKGPEAFLAAATLYRLASTGLRGRDYGGAGIVGPAEARRRMGDLAPDGLTGGGVWRDGQILDANRLHLACLRGAVEAGARAANHMEAVALRRGGSGVTGALVRDRLDGHEAELTARVTISCTGAAARDLAGGAGQAWPGFARATNVVVDRPADAAAFGIVSRDRSDAAVDRGGRMYFLTPWQGRTIIGTHEIPASDGLARDEGDVTPFLREIEIACPALALRAEDVLWTYQGLIPADVDDGRGGVRRHTRGSLIDHSALDGLRGLISVMGVKYTTARLIAARAVDAAVRQVERPVPPSHSLQTPLPTVGLAPVDPDDETALAARLRTAFADEMAQTLEDVVLRRTCLAETGALRGPAGETRLARLEESAASQRGWDAAHRVSQLTALRQALGGVTR
ncbi:MAG: FAD-dependent oxidoreductase [Pseudomonadota bacterium]